MTPVGSWAQLGATARWEDLAPVSSPVALDAPLGWLAPDGYAVATADAVLELGPVVWSTIGGPSVHAPGADATAGGMVRSGLDWDPGPVGVGAAAVAATVMESALAGGLLGCRYTAGEVSLGAQVGAFRFTPLAGPQAWVREGRLSVGSSVWSRPQSVLHSLHLRGELAAGTDRVLDPWLRAGVVLSAGAGHLDRGRM